MENLIEASVDYSPQVKQIDSCVYRRYNNFLAAVHEAYSQHRKLVLTPDIIWLAICQGVAIHMKQPNFALDDSFFTDSRPANIRVRNDDLANNSEAWGTFVSQLNKEVLTYTKNDLNAFFRGGFSSSNVDLTPVYQITMLDAVSNKFEYVAESGCGIPEITLEGTPEDWKVIYSRLNALDQFGLTHWKAELKPVMEEFVAASMGKPNTAFWKSMYKDLMVYGQFNISGWIIKFFPYIEGHDSEAEMQFDEALQVYTRKTKHIPNPYLTGDLYLKSDLSTMHIPSGLAKIPVTWFNYFDQTKTRITLHAGFLGIEQKADGALKPMITWAVSKVDSSFETHSIRSYSKEKLIHRPFNWIPNYFNQPSVSVQYEHPNFSDSIQAKWHLTNRLIEALKAQNLWSDSLKGSFIQVGVLSNGSLAEVRFKDIKTETTVEQVLLETVRAFGGSWTPAIVHIDDLKEMDWLFRQEGFEKTLKVNAWFLLKIE